MEDEYYDESVHLVRHLPGKDVVWCRKSFVFKHMKTTELEEECTCSTCRGKLKLEKQRKAKLNEMRAKLGGIFAEPIK